MNFTAKYKSMDIEVKRKLYKCGESFLTNEQIPNWMEANAKLLGKILKYIEDLTLVFVCF